MYIYVYIYVYINQTPVSVLAVGSDVRFGASCAPVVN